VGEVGLEPTKASASGFTVLSPALILPGNFLLCRIYVALRSITVARVTASAEPGGANLAQCLLCRLL
jgi:hypothetical protein